MLGCTMKSLHFCNLFCWFKCHVNVPNDVKCVNVLLTKIKVQRPAFLRLNLGVATEKPGLSGLLGMGCLYPMATLYLK